MKSSFLPILKREYMTRVTTKAFWIATAIFPLMAAAFTVLPPILASRSKSAAEPVRIVDFTGKFFPVMQDVATKSKGEEDEASRPLLVAEPIAGRDEETIRRSLNVLAEKGTIQGYVIIDQKRLDDGDMVLSAKNPSSALGSDWLRNVVRRAVTKYRLSGSGVDETRIDRAIERVSFSIEKATNDPKKRESGVAALFMSFGLVMFIYFALILYGIYVLRGVLEEKSNRIVEVMISSVRPFDLMLGKILGIGAVGLTQITIWVFFATLLTSPQIAMMLSISEDFKPAANGMALAFFPVYFVLGYFLYATIFAGIGSMFNSDEEAQQMAGVAQLFLIVPMMMLMPVIKDPNGPLATWMSLFPFFSPILMYLRIATGAPPAWQIALSIVIMIATILIMVWIVSKIYRIGILMYGKKPTIPELMRWLRYT